MKKIFLSLALFAAVSLIACEACKKYIPCEKTYVKPHQVTKDSGHIYVTLANGKIVEVQQLLTDGHGTYFVRYRKPPTQ